MATAISDQPPARPAISGFERYLSLWVALCIAVGIALGAALPQAFAAIAAAEVARVNLPVAALVWLMIVPMLLRIDFAALGQVRQHMRGVGVTLFINWAVKPFSMALLGTLFIGWLFRPLLPPDQIESYIAGLILLAASTAITVNALAGADSWKWTYSPGWSRTLAMVSNGSGVPAAFSTVSTASLR